LEAVQFKRPKDVQALLAQIGALNVKPVMVVIDTFARSAVGLNENDATEVGLWIDAVSVLKDQMGVDIVALHHAQKAKATKNGTKPVREREQRPDWGHGHRHPALPRWSDSEGHLRETEGR
jgi:hypothetical protein